MVLKSAMKWGEILIFCILLSSYVTAKDVTLGIGESYVRDGVNITLAKISKDYDKAVICVNNEKQILEEDQLAYFKNTSLEIDHIDRKDRTVDIDIDWIAGCIGCKCTGDCLNPDCKIEQYDEWGELINGGTIENISEDKTAEPVRIIKQKKISRNAVIIFGIIGGIMGVFLVWLFWLRKMSF